MIHTAKPWEGRLAEVEEARQRRRQPNLRIIVSQPGAKGRPPQRQCPADFDVIFVEVGRLDCETWYRAGRIMVNRWLEERGKQRLIMERARFVKHLRMQGKKPQGPPTIQVATDRRPVAPELARMAADFLRIRRNGGWMISATGQGDWFVGSCRKSAGDMVTLAECKGFDRVAALASLAVTPPEPSNYLLEKPCRYSDGRQSYTTIAVSGPDHRGINPTAKQKRKLAGKPTVNRTGRGRKR